MSYTLAEAAAACGIDKSTVRRAVRSGRISGTRDEAGTWHVEAAELHRVFPPAARTEGDTTAVPRDAPPNAVDSTTDALVSELRAVIADLRGERDRLLAVIERQALLPAPKPPEEEKPRPWSWRWLRTS
jgi:excisionase family DNA binding protein